MGRSVRKIFHWLQGRKKFLRKQKENRTDHPTLRRNPRRSHLTRVQRKRREKAKQRRKIRNLMSLRRNLKTSPPHPRKCHLANRGAQLSRTYPTRVKRRRRKTKMTRTRKLEFNPKLFLPSSSSQPEFTHLQKRPRSQKLLLRMRTKRTRMTDSSLLPLRPKMKRIKKKTPVTRSSLDGHRILFLVQTSFWIHPCSWSRRCVCCCSLRDSHWRVVNLICSVGLAALTV